MRTAPRALEYRPGSLGDTLVSPPAMADIRVRYPSHHLTLLTERPLADSTRVSPWTILGENGWFDSVHFYAARPAIASERSQSPAPVDFSAPRSSIASPARLATLFVSHAGR